ncbi:WYL domain-containing protein [Stenotrophomonas sp. C3(2023)]|uniref:helix-turn-helix transcriptional regulator n=1 Tax=Stenotrophomonas sp. C3(2023) TaxID=3080277 RepID=UPI00293CE3CA|nr:WYL domain-containing protein [Stenotrophomonas sp. C3(2023)]MDV3469176.1 WYL domain-containing protein [Stenotrophomonas sp. C3(2023)]
MRHTAQRLLRLISLLQARRHWSGAELAERMQVDRRSIRRDIERLRELGYPVHASAGVGGGYQMGAGAPVLPLLLDEDEATTLALALRAAASSVAGLDERADSLLAKLDPLVPRRRRQEAGQIHAATATVIDRAALDGHLLGQLAQYCRQTARLRLDYRSADGTPSRRTLEAQHLVNCGQRWYLLAWDLGREAWRTLRVDRICTVQASGSGRRRAPPAPPQVMVQQAVSQSPFPLQAVLRLAGNLANLQRQVPYWCGVLEAEGPDHCLLRLGADTPGLLLSLILSVDQPLLDCWTTPPALRAALMQRLQQVGDALGPEPATPAPGPG